MSALDDDAFDGRDRGAGFDSSTRFCTVLSGHPVHALRFCLSAQAHRRTQRKNCRGRFLLRLIGADFRAPLKRGTRRRQVSRRARLDLLPHYVAGGLR
jgi:hypothetical protein